MKKSFTILVFLFNCAGVMASESVEVFSTIKPIDSLIKSIVGQSIEIGLLINNNHSPHDFRVKPSQIKQLKRAKVIFYIDEEFDHYINNLLNALPPQVEKIAFTYQNGIIKYTSRKLDNWHSSLVDARQFDAKQLHSINHHIWLDIDNAISMATIISDKLSDYYPKNKDTFQENLKQLRIQLTDLDIQIKSKLADVKKNHFIVQHDAYVYFEKKYGLTSLAAISSSHSPISIKRVKYIVSVLENNTVHCIFQEPHHSTGIINTITQGFDINIGNLDPIASQIEPSKQLYFELMKSISNEFHRCLSD